MNYLERLSFLAAVLLVGGVAAGCELVVDFDRSRIGDGGVGMEGGRVDAMLDARPDAMADAAEDAADAAEDAAADAPVDAPPVDAPPVDAPPVDAPPMDAPPLDAPPMDAPADSAVDAPPMDAPADSAVDAPGDGAVDAPPADADAPADGGIDGATDPGDGAVDAGECTSNPDCDDADSCTMDVCDAGTCVNMPIAGCCTESADCSGSTPLCDTTAMQCVECLGAGDCDDADACTTDTCDGTGTCVNTQITDCCTESADCSGSTPLCDTTAMQCVECLGADDCDDADACTTDTCDGTGTCVNTQITDCCTGDGDCGGGTPACDTATNTCVECTEDSDCSGGSPVCDTETKTCVECTMDAHCDDASDCTVDSCVSNSCDFDAGAMEGLDCDDGDFCVVGETCSTGLCQGGSANDCDDGDSCTVDSCDEMDDQCVNRSVGDTLAAVGFETGGGGEDQVRLRNETAVELDFTGFHACNDAATCEALTQSAAADATVTATLATVDVGSSSGQLALSSASDGSVVCDYVQWGAGGQSLEDEAVTAGEWAADDFVDMSGFADTGICVAAATDNSNSTAWSHCTF